MRTGYHVLYNGKDYQGELEGEDTLQITTDNEKDVDESFEYDSLFECYEKYVKIDEVSEYYKIIAMCDYMGETFEPLGIKEDRVVLYKIDDRYLEKGFIPEGRDGYIKKLKTSEVTIRLVKENHLLYYRMGKVLRERIGDDSNINDFSIGELNKRIGHGMKGCFFYDGNYYVYSKDYSKEDSLEIRGPFGEKDTVYACAKILEKEDLFQEYEFSDDAKQAYMNNIFHTEKEMEKYAYSIRK